MISYLIYNKSGRIRRIGCCQEHLFNQVPLKDGEAIMRGYANPTEHYISLAASGIPTICRKSDEQIAEEERRQQTFLRTGDIE